ncbi:MAG TPA: ATPase, T2SS/T4P/T4SS family [Syntrophales bacterium]|nr:ATPase, T2SS/T4P/T4SS family [Syntrophales bacterium]
MGARLPYFDFHGFKAFLRERLAVPGEVWERVKDLRPPQLYGLALSLGIPEGRLASLVAAYLEVPYLPGTVPEQFQEGYLSRDFCLWNLIAPIITPEGETAFLLSNPFLMELIDILNKRVPPDRDIRLAVAEPSVLKKVLGGRAGRDEGGGDGGDAVEGERTVLTVIDSPETVSEEDLEKRPVVYVANNILYSAVKERASDIHIEPKARDTVVRFRIDGDLRDMFTLKKATGTMVISRLKALAGLDIAEKQRPQDGAVEVVIDRRNFKLRLATTSTPNGESLIMRLLEPTAKPVSFEELGLTKAQIANLMDFARRRYGLLLVVGPTGSGKSTTLYTFLSHVDTTKRSLITVEDPVEYRIPNANQQQVNEKAGVTFEALLKSSVRQDPDILYLGEIRDNFSARIAVDFASTGHMTVSTLHTNNATTAIFRLERLGVTRDIMAEALIGIVAQRLLKKLCPHCRRVEPLTEEEKEMLSPFTDELPARSAHPVGCHRCIEGYRGREGVYEVIPFDAAVSDLIRRGAPILKIREFIRGQGHYLMSNHAVEKVRDLVFPVRDVYEKILVEEIPAAPAEPSEGPQRVAEKSRRRAGRILVVEDDQDSQLLIERILKGAGYEVALAADGIDALITLAKEEFDLIISDINMPNLDGFKLLEIKNQKGIGAPLIFLTGRVGEEDEIKGLEMGALDYLKKPVKKDILLLKIRNVLFDVERR